jgi:glucose uptake protein GlcU
VQHRAAGDIPSDRGVVRLIIDLFRSPQWLLGSAFALTAFGLHITAMNLGVVAVVQPFLLGAVLLAVPLRAFLDKTIPTREEMFWVAFTVVGIIVFVYVANSHRDNGPPHDNRALVVVLVGFTAAAVWASTARRFQRGSVRGFVYATASGLTFGITAGLMKFVRHDAANGWVGLFQHWHIWALLVGSVLGTTLNQRSYQASTLSVSMPSMNSVNIVVAVTFGWVVFSEPPASSPLSFVIQLICLVAMGVGLLKVARAEDALEESLKVRETKSTQVRPSVS